MHFNYANALPQIKQIIKLKHSRKIFEFPICIHIIIMLFISMENKHPGNKQKTKFNVGYF